MTHGRSGFVVLRARLEVATIITKECTRGSAVWHRARPKAGKAETKLAPGDGARAISFRVNLKGFPLSDFKGDPRAMTAFS